MKNATKNNPVFVTTILCTKARSDVNMRFWYPWNDKSICAFKYLLTQSIIIQRKAVFKSTVFLWSCAMKEVFYNNSA